MFRTKSALYDAFHMMTNAKRVGGVILLVGCLVLGKYVREHRVGYGANSYVNMNIPMGFVFIEEGEIPDSFRVDDAYSNIQQVGGMFSDTFYCSQLKKNADIVKYWQYTAGYGISGGWSYRFAAVCGDEYVVVYGADHLGELVYGPFSLQR